MAAAVVGNDSKALVEEDQHLRIPIVGAQWPPMAEYNRLAGAPILVKDLDAVRSSEGVHALVRLSRICAGGLETVRRHRPFHANRPKRKQSSSTQGCP
jgi:hypothetical protein